MRGFSAAEIAYSALIALLLLLVMLTRVRPPQLAVFLAALAFVMLLAGPRLWQWYKTPRRARVDVGRSLRESRELVAEIGRLTRDPSLANHPGREVREAARQIHLTLGRIVQAIGQDENKRAVAELVLRGYITPTRDILRQYVKLSSRGVETAEGELVATERELPAIEARLNRLFNYIHEEDIVNLSVLNDMVEESVLVDDVSPQGSIAPRE